MDVESSHKNDKFHEFLQNITRNEKFNYTLFLEDELRLLEFIQNVEEDFSQKIFLFGNYHGFVIAVWVVFIIMVAVTFTTCCYCCNVENKYNLHTKKVNDRYTEVKTAAIRDIKKEKDKKEVIAVEDLTPEHTKPQKEHHHHHHKHHKHHDKKEVVVDPRGLDVEDHLDHLNIKNSVVYITQSPSHHAHHN